jgi:hypothetical protein
MKSIVTITLVLSLMLPAVAGCDAIDIIFGATTVTVSLVNDADYTVEVELYIDDEQEIPKFLLTETDKLSYSIPAGETRSFTRDCEDLQAIIIDDADLMIIGGLGPDADTDVFRDGDDFDCGDTIIFTFDHSDVIVDFNISTEVRRGGLLLTG